MFTLQNFIPNQSGSDILSHNQPMTDDSRRGEDTVINVYICVGVCVCVCSRLLCRFIAYDFELVLLSCLAFHTFGAMCQMCVFVFFGLSTILVR